MDNKLFDALGLSKHERVVYLALLHKSPATISAIVRETALHRPTVYRVLPLLINKQLVAESPYGKRKRYSVGPPSRLRDVVATISAQLAASLPELEMLFQRTKHQPAIQFLRGKEGIVSVFSDIIHSLHRGDVFYRYSSRKDATTAMRYLPSDYEKVRDEKQLQRMVITNKLTASQKERNLNRVAKVVPRDFDLFEHNVTEIIYGSKIAFVDYNTESAVVIENGAVAELQKSIFKLLYSKL